MTIPFWLHILTAALTVYRCTHMIISETGPDWIFRRIREVIPKASSFHEGIRCPFCMSIWVGFPVAVWLMTYNVLPHWLVLIGDTFTLWMALSATSIIVHCVFTPKEKKPRKAIFEVDQKEKKT